jgi:hypothetical protein
MSIQIRLVNKDTAEGIDVYVLRGLYPGVSFPDTVFGVISVLSECDGTEPWAVWEPEITERADERSDG